MIRDVVWEWCGNEGLEHLRLDTEGAVRAEGRLVVGIDGAVVGLRYSVLCDAAWRFQAANLQLGSETHGIAHSPAGWEVDGESRPDLHDCIDIDIRMTPFTNTLPIRRLRFAAGEPMRIAVAYIYLPEFSVARAEQEYTALEHNGLGQRRFRYRSLDSGFTAELATDADGLVLEYGTIWRRRTPELAGPADRHP